MTVLTKKELDELNEDETRDQLFHPLMREYGYPSPSATVAEVDHYKQQRHLRVESQKREKRRYDGCYCVSNAPIVLVELKRYSEIRNGKDLEDALEQAVEEAKSPDFKKAPPFILISNGTPEWTRMHRQKRLGVYIVCKSGAFWI